MSVANNAEVTQIGGVTGKGFLPGQSGNPTGRPKGVAKQFRDAIGDDPTRFAEKLLECIDDGRVKWETRVMAIREYLDRGYGKAPAYAPVEGGDPLDRDQLDERIESLVDELATRRQSKSRGKAAVGDVAGTQSKT